MKVIIEMTREEALTAAESGILTSLFRSDEQKEQLQTDCAVAEPVNRIAEIPVSTTPAWVPVDNAPAFDAPPATPVAPVAPVVQAPVSQPAVPTAERVYTIDEISRAAIGLMDAGKKDVLMGLLKQFGVESLPMLKPEQYGQFVIALRGQGALI